MTMVSRVLGLWRDHFLARFFGTGMISSYWEIAYMFPNMLRNLLAEGILSQSFIPLYSESLKKSELEGKLSSGKIIGFLSIFFVIFISIMIFLFPLILPLYVGKQKEEIELLIFMSQILFVFIGFISIASVFSGILNTHNSFVIPSLVPIILNLVFIFTFLSILFLNSFIVISIETVAIILSITVVLGSVFTCFFLYFVLKRNRIEPKIQFFYNYWKEPIVKKLFSMVLPAIIGASIFQLNQLLDIFLASYLVKVEGAIPALRFAHRLIQLPTGIIGVAISTTILPVLVQHIRNHVSRRESGMELFYAIRFSLYLTIPATIGLYLLGPWIVHFLFSGGLWNFQSTVITWWCLQFYVLGIPFYSMNKILTSSYYAYQNTKTPVRILFLTISLNLIMNLLLIPILEHGGLALSTSLSSIFNFALLLFFIRRNLEIPLKEFFYFIKNILSISFVIIIYLLILKIFFTFPFEKELYSFTKSLLYNDFNKIQSLPSREYSLFVLAIGISGSMAIHFLLSKKLLSKEWKVIEEIFSKKLIKNSKT